MKTLNRHEVERIIEYVTNQNDRDGDLPDWDYWRDSGTVNCWLADGWLLQVGHSYPIIALENRDEGKAATGEPANEETAVTFIGAAIVNPSAALAHLRGQEQTLSYSSSTIIDEENGRAVSHFDFGSNANEETA